MSKKFTRCAVPCCKNIKYFNQGPERPGLLFFNFPKGKQVEWAKAIGRSDLELRFQKYRPTHLRVCSDHFGEEDYAPDVANKYFNLNVRRRLAPDAVPSLLLERESSSGEEEEVEKEETNRNENDACTSSEAVTALPGDEEDSWPWEEELDRKGEKDPRKESQRGFCLICSEACYSSEEFSPGFEEYKFPGASDISLLNKQLWSTFVLRKVLELPSWKYEDILKTNGEGSHPSEWFVVCDICSKLFIQILGIEEKIKSLQVETDKLKETVRDKFKNSLEPSGGPYTDNSTNETCRKDIRSFMIGTKLEPQTDEPCSQQNEDDNLSIYSGASLGTPDKDPGSNENEDLKVEARKEDKGLDEDRYLSSETSDSECSLPLEQFDKLEAENIASKFKQIASAVSSSSSLPSKKKVKGFKKFPCKLCPRKYVCKQIFQRHIQLHKETKLIENGRYDCSVCGVPYDNAISVYHHLKLEHGLSIHHSWKESGEPQKDYIFSRETKKSVLANLRSKVKLKDIDLQGSSHLVGPTKKKAIYQCTICPRKLTLKGYLKKHLEFHKRTKALYKGRFDCSRCKAPYTKFSDLSMHYRLEHRLKLNKRWETSKKPQENYLIDYTPRKKVILDAEKEKTEDGEDFPCSECSKSFKSNHGLRTHKVNVHKIRDKEVCEICGFVATKVDTLKKHIYHHKMFDNSVDPSVSTTEFICNLCKKLFKTRRQLTKHKVSNHAEELDLEVFQCTQCPQKFPRKNNWMYHEMKIHRKMGKYQCEECGYQAVNLNILEKHKVKHSGALVVCQHCSATYSSETLLRDHIRRYHPDKYVVEKKRKFFVGVPVDKLSIEGDTPGWNGWRRGLSEKPFKCKYCGAMMPHKLALNFHLKDSHKDMYKHECSMCDKVYMSLTSLNLHMKINHKEKDKAVRCAWCLKKVSHKLYLYTHAKICPNPKKPKNGENLPKIMAVDVDECDSDEGQNGQNETNPKKITSTG